MAHATDDLTENDIDAYLRAHEHKSLLRFITCGSVDDGKSTLIGRLLYDSKLVYSDHLNTLEADSRSVGTQGGELDFALLVDGLAAEREQGITIDVAYRFFSTERRKFIVADTPGHEQYTRNMVTGASTADLAVILIDARKGVLTQTRRHSYLVSLLGIRKVVLAVNKLDLMGFAQDTFDAIEADYRRFAAGIGLGDIVAIPMSALGGDNVLSRSPLTPWYEGPTLVDHLECVEVADERAAGPFRFPVQWVNRPHLDFRGFSGQIAGGAVRPGDAVTVLPSGRTSTVARIVTADGDLDEAQAGDSVTLTLADELDVSRGDVIAASAAPPEVADQFEAHLVWMSEEAMLPGRAYQLKLGTRTVGMTVGHVKYKTNVNTLERTAARTLQLNDIGVATVMLDRPVPFDPYSENRDTGGFIVIDKFTRSTVGAGLLNFALRRSHTVTHQDAEIDRSARAAGLGQRPVVVWFTGIPGAGKSTIADLVERRLHREGRHTYLLDGDNVRHGLNRDLGFADPDRVENVRRIGEVAGLMVDAGLIVLVSCISPFRAERALARSLVADGQFVEVHVDAPLELAEARDRKGLYARARRGELANFTGIDSPYETPEHPEMRLTVDGQLEASAAADRVVAYLLGHGHLAGPPSTEV